MGDLEFRSDFTGEYYTCLQCSKRAEQAGSVGKMALLAPNNSAGFSRPGPVFS
jgi:hypothetical protein